jgi:CRP-like cAMP-binding protein
MARSAESISRNHLLTRMSRDDRALLQPSLKPVDLPVEYVLEHPNKRIDYVYFLESGITSFVALSGKHHKIEVGIIGREGVSSPATVLGSDRSPTENFIQIKGHGQRIRSGDLVAAMRKSSSLQLLLIQFAQSFLVQTAHTALANGRAKLEERLARWVLMAHDRVDGNEVPLTHEFLALMLGVRRPGVTVALHILEGNGLIRSTRGMVEVLDREGLIELCDGIYGIPEGEAKRLVGWQSPHAH